MENHEASYEINALSTLITRYESRKNCVDVKQNRIKIEAAESQST